METRTFIHFHLSGRIGDILKFTGGCLILIIMLAIIYAVTWIFGGVL